ncbi:MAG TPA: ATP-dependent helicase [Oscillatoriaceae cyanobacterium]
MIETLSLRPAQAKILAYQSGTLAISAVPGAGKTFVLTQLAASLVDVHGVRPSEILILTYMRSAAQTFKRRIATALAERGRNAYGLQAMTIHAFCLSVVKQAWARDEDEPLNVLQDAEKIRCLMEGLEAFLVNPSARAQWKARYGDADGDPYNDPRQLTYKAALKAIGAAKTHGLSPAALAEILGDRQPELAYLYRDYQAQLDARRALDYDDLIARAIVLLQENPALLSAYHRRIRFVMEDEAQDSTPAQNALIRLLTDPALGAAGNLVRVGDSNQAIMTSFTFNDPRFFRGFCEDQEAAGRHVAMDESSRSAPEIIAIANALVAEVGRHPDPVVCEAFKRLQIREATAGKQNPTATRPPNWTQYPKKEDEQFGVLSQVREYLRANPESRAAILVFSNKQFHEFRDRARAMGIPLYEEEHRGGGTKACLELLKQALVFLSLPEENHNRLFGELLFARVKQRRESWHDLKAVRHYLKDAPLEALVYDDLPPHRPSELVESDYARILELAKILRRLLDARHLPVTEFLPTMAQCLTDDPHAPAIAAKAAAIAKQHVRSWEDPLFALSLELHKLLEASGDKELVAATEVLPPKPGELEVCTLHRSKGAEYDAVWLPCLGNYYKNKTFFPWELEQAELRDHEAFLAEQAIVHHDNPSPPSTTEAHLEAQRLLVAERLRLLYVGITRAERELHLSGYGDSAPPHVQALAMRCERRQA